jgi:hypothetical protein
VRLLRQRSQRLVEVGLGVADREKNRDQRQLKKALQGIRDDGLTGEARRVEGLSPSYRLTATAVNARSQHDSPASGRRRP